MKTQRRHIGALEFINDILLARARLTQAKNDLALAGAQMQTAMRRGKENQPDARSAQRQIRHAEMEFIKARTALAKIEKNYLTAVQQAVRKPATPRLAAGEAAGNQPLSGQLKHSGPSGPSAAHVIKEKKPATAFRRLPLAASRAAARTSGQQGSITRP